VKIAVIFSKVLILIVSACGIVLFLVFLHLVVFAVMARPRAADVIIILGSQALNGVRPGSELALRLDEGLRLYNEGYAASVIVSGGAGHNERWPEAEVMRDYLVERGVPRGAISVENRSDSTWENMQYSLPLLEKLGARSVILVSSPLHLARVALTGRRLGYPAMSFSFNKKTHYMSLREVIAFIGYDLFYR
jgi:uncharacterized SAM-binding protein YcdF (DUF218 family)